MPKKKTGKKLKQRSSGDLVETNLELNFRIQQKYHLTERQLGFITLAEDENTNMIICDGPAGTSKTYCSVLVALKMLQQKKCNEILYIRSIVESATRKLGSLPGEVDEKFKPWSIPLLEKCDELVGSHIADDLLKSNLIKCIPVNFLRGSTFKDCVVIIDEAQNLEMSEIITILTRFGRNCKMFIIGDTLQSDIAKTCFKSVFNVFSGDDSSGNGIHTFAFSEEDITRSKLLRYIVAKVKGLK